MRSSRASNFPLTWPTTSREFEYTFTTSPPNSLTIANPANRSSYSVSLFVARKLNHNDFSITSFIWVITTIPTPAPFQLAAPSMYTSQVGTTEAETVIMSTIPFLSSVMLSVNSATKSANTCPFMTVRGMYLTS